MLGLDRRVLQAAWTLFIFALLVAGVYVVRRPLVIFMLAIFLAQLLSPMVDLVSRYTPHRVSRTVVLAVVYLALIAILLLITIPIASRIAEEAAVLAVRLPDALKQPGLLDRVPLPGWLEFVRPRVTQFLSNLDDRVFPFLRDATGQILAGIGNVLVLLLIPILSFFFLKDGPAIRDAIVQSAPKPRQPKLVRLLNDLHLLLSGYLRALVTLAAFTFVSHLALLSILGVPYAILLAGIAGVLEFIPVVGPLTGATAIVLVALFGGYAHVLWIVLILAAYRIFQDYVLSPYLMSANISLHPLLVLFGVLAGEQIAGVAGMFFSIPLIAALRLIVASLRAGEA